MVSASTGTSGNSDDFVALGETFDDLGLGRFQDALQEFDKGFWTFYRKRAKHLFGVDRSEEGTTAAPKRSKKEKGEEVGVQEEVEKWLLASNLTPFDIGTGINHKASPAVIAQALGLEESGLVRTALNRPRKNWK